MVLSVRVSPVGWLCWHTVVVDTTAAWFVDDRSANEHVACLVLVALEVPESVGQECMMYVTLDPLQLLHDLVECVAQSSNVCVTGTAQNSAEEI